MCSKRKFIDLQIKLLRERNEISWCPILCSIESRNGLKGYTRWIECPDDRINTDLDRQSKIMFALAGKAAEAVHFNYGPNYIKKLLSQKETSDFKERGIINF